MAMPGWGPVDDGPWGECEECGAVIRIYNPDDPEDHICADCQRERDEAEEAEAE